jgi:DNA-binding response OmpR family regulator
LNMPKILVIEDEPDQNKLIKLRLEARGYRVISVGRAREGIEAARRERPDLILMDMILPDMHGLDATIKLKRSLETSRIPIIAISAVGSPDFTKACLQEGILAYVRKPYDPRDLFKTIEKYARPPELEDKKLKARPVREAEPPVPHSAAVEKQPEREKRRKPKVEELLRGVLSDFRIRQEKKASAPASGRKIPPVDTSKAGGILIIDDDISFSKLVAPCLTEHGYDVNIALDGVSGLKEAFLNVPSLILLNLVLPAGSGESVLANLRKSPDTSQVPVFIMSSLLSPRKLEEKAREIRAQGFISKPVEPEDLLFIIESVVGS